MDLGKLRVIMEEENLDAVVAISPENVFYTTGAYITTQKDIRDRYAIAIFDCTTDPTFIVCSIEEAGARADSWIKDIRTYTEFEESPMDLLSAVIKEKKLDGKKIGIEKHYLSVFYYEQIMHSLPNTNFVECQDVFSRIRMIKAENEIETLKNAACTTRKVIDAAFLIAKPGDSEKRVANIMLTNLLESGADQIAFMVLGTGHRSSIVHPIPSEKAFLSPGDIVRVDFGGIFNGYFSDVARTAAVEKPTRRQAEVYKKLVHIQKEVIANMKVGSRFCDIYNLCKRLFIEEGLAFTMPHIGHGLGVDLHEDPMIHPLNQKLLEENMVLCVEPLLEDEGYGYHVEDLVLITNKGPQVLTGATFDDNIPVIV